MKKSTFLTIAIILISVISMLAQVPNSMKYQAIARDNLGEALKNQDVKFRIHILAETIGGQSVYSETHSVTTNAFGVVNLNIGEGDGASSTLSQINWGMMDHYIKIEMDPAGGNDFKEMGTAQLLTVPYAFFAQNGVQFRDDIVCDESTEGMIRYNYDSKTLEVCNGESWVELGDGGSSGFNCGEALVDARDGQSYMTVKIGNQCWMKENLNFGTYKESIFTNDPHSDVSNDGIVEKYAFDNDEAYLELYGGLYDWNEMMNYSITESTQGICPDGWHIPSYDEIEELVENSGDWILAGKGLKVGGSSGFEFALGGNRREKGNFTGGGGTTGSFWSSTNSTSHPDSRAWNIYFIEAGDNAAKATDVMSTGKSCRCVKD